jgi:hypothetical protein
MFDSTFVFRFVRVTYLQEFCHNQRAFCDSSGHKFFIAYVAQWLIAGTDEEPEAKKIRKLTKSLVLAGPSAACESAVKFASWSCGKSDGVGSRTAAA